MASRKSTPCSNSSGDDEQRYAMMDEKKRKRMISNRESARRSRMKKERHMKDLTEQITHFDTTRDEMVRQIDDIVQRHANLELENRVLRAQREELKKRLETAEALGNCVYGTRTGSGYSSKMENAAGDGPQEPWLQQWQPSYNAFSVMTSGRVFKI